MPAAAMINVNRKALIQAFVELEQEYSIKYFLLAIYVKQLTDTLQELDALFDDNRILTARDKVLKLLNLTDDFEEELTDGQIDTWMQEAQKSANTPSKLRQNSLKMLNLAF